MVRLRSQKRNASRDYLDIIALLTDTVDVGDPFWADVTRQAISGCHNYEALLILLKALTIPGYQESI